MRKGAFFLLSTATATAADAAVELFELDTQFNPLFPVGSHSFSAVAIGYPQNEDPHIYVTQRGNTSLAPVFVLGTQGELLDMWGQNYIAKDPVTDTWGAHGIAVEMCPPETVCAEGDLHENMRVYVNDFDQYTLSIFSQSGTKLATLGTPGTEGNGTSLILQFGHLADTYIKSGKYSSEVYVSDGDGGTANRVVKLDAPMVLGTRPAFVWATRAIFNNPHSLTLHDRTGLLVVADRDNAQLRLLRATDGMDMGFLVCGLGLGIGGKPFGVRTWSSNSHDLLIVSIMDNPMDGKNQKIVVVDMSRISNTGGKCNVLQTIVVDSDKYSGPHLLGVDIRSGFLYAALVADAPKSALLRYKFLG
jgi:hypothetical protein